MGLYREAVSAWGLAMPVQLKRLHDRSDESVFDALKEIIGDVTSQTWTIDAKIAWRLMQCATSDTTRS